MKGIVPIFKDFCKKNAATILTVSGSIGIIGTVILTVKATLKSKEDYDVNFKNEILLHGNRPSKKDVIALCWKNYIPTALSAMGTISCVVGANIVNVRVQKNLSNAYNLLNAYFFAYKDQVKDIYGEEAHNKIVDGIIKHKCKDVYIYNQGLCHTNYISFDTENPDEIRTFYDSYSQRYFETTIARLLEAEYSLNRNFIMGGYVSINDFYSFLGLAPIEGGDTLGWNNFLDDIYWIDFTHSKTNLDDGMEVLVVDFDFGPESMPYDI